MSSAQGDGRCVSQFALVSYVPSPLSKFLDDLRIKLTPESRPHAHVTVLPPRPIHSDLQDVKALLGPALRDVHRIYVELGSIRIFPVSNVIYLSIERGEDDLRALNHELDRGVLRFKTAFSYHPHITLAQDIPAEDAERLASIAREEWGKYQGERGFVIDSLWLVQNVVPQVWLECGLFPLAVPAPALR